MNMDELVKEIVKYGKTLVEIDREYEARVSQKIEDLSAEGYTIVEGGQTGENSWEMTNYETGDTIARGSLREEWERILKEVNGAHIDRVRDWAFVDNDDVPLPSHPFSRFVCEAMKDRINDYASVEEVEEAIEGLTSL
ncbi:hypothetical protein [Streptomyces mirabilis]|uniref:hypothetical protein n=1 Tax=Streptomyces mirabilis TaxID=68239 RepID=UPI0034380CA4